MGLQDLAYVVDAHADNFPDGFFARLGPRFLRQYYRTFLDGPLATCVVVEHEGRPCGYLVGILDPPQHRRLMLRYHAVSLALAAGLGMFRRPRLAATFVVTRLGRYRAALVRSSRGGAARGPAMRTAVLSHVAVSEAYRRSGIGTILVDEFLAEAHAAGCARACLVTQAGPEGAGDFYARRGWTFTHQRRTTEGRDLTYYERQVG